jgi:hypothetical protein
VCFRSAACHHYEPLVFDPSVQTLELVLDGGLLPLVLVCTDVDDRPDSSTRAVQGMAGQLFSRP